MFQINIFFIYDDINDKLHENRSRSHENTNFILYLYHILGNVLHLFCGDILTTLFFAELLHS